MNLISPLLGWDLVKGYAMRLCHERPSHRAHPAMNLANQESNRPGVAKRDDLALCLLECLGLGIQLLRCGVGLHSPSRRFSGSGICPLIGR